MQANKAYLANVLNHRLGNTEPNARRWLAQASEVIVFGSMSAGLERPDSDVDVLCIADRDYKLKSKRLDLIGVSYETRKTEEWLHGELAAHVAKYGVWIKGTASWKYEVRIGAKAVDEKRRRVSAFMRSLQKSWLQLEECFRVKYSVKLRRETQRLILLERNVAVPPTRILDAAWASVSSTPYDVGERLRQFTPKGPDGFTHDLLCRVHAQLEGNQIPN
jgi:predicted nucleotidyltransferase